MNGASLDRLVAHGAALTRFWLAVAFLLGSAVYIGGPSLSLTNVLATLAFPLVCWIVFTSRPRLEVIPVIASFALLLVLTLMVAIAVPEVENLRLLRGVLVAIVGTAGASWFASRDAGFVLRVVQSVLALAAIHAMLQGTYLLFGLGLDPRLDEQVIDSLSSGVLSIGLPSFLGNPNNFSVFAGLTGIYFGVQATRVGVGWHGLCLLCVLASGSRTVFLLSLLWSALLLVRRHRWRGALFGAALLGSVTLAVAATKGESGLYVVDRTYNGINEMMQRDLTDGGSLNVRQRSHLYFVTHYGSFTMGAFDGSKPFGAFRNAGFDDALIRVNPHSFVIELHALFGLFGLLVVLLFATSLGLMLVRRLGSVLAIATGAIIALYSAVPSSIFQFHVFFVLVTLIAVDAPSVPTGRRTRVGGTSVRV